MTTQDKDSPNLLDAGASVGALVPVSRVSGSDSEELGSEEKGNVLTILPVKNAVLFPHNVVPVTPTSQWGHEALEKAARKGTTLGIVALRNEPHDPVRSEDLYLVGTEAKIVKVIRFPDGTAGAVVQGTRRFKVE